MAFITPPQPTMNDARTLSHFPSLTLPLSAASASNAQPLGDELSDDDLEQVVGGLARRRDASRSERPAESSYTVAAAPAQEIVHRVSA